ncbi:hypothetical protein [Oricola sp.]|uniref:hypothetical protein n=1 Tax=Oricola sp. TaxID=1979950 RepID=UPI000C8C5F53|nr:hypothetical protein [Ahrensia sp.]|tara:strand:+ start:27444 stop:27674 length:231 start_codon:yes stop_codon:yes gene_type:complete
MQSNTIRTNAFENAKSRATTSPTIPSPFKWLRDLNAGLIAYFQFKDLSDEQLRNVGITKRQQSKASLRQFMPRDDR